MSVNNSSEISTQSCPNSGIGYYVVGGLGIISLLVSVILYCVIIKKKCIKGREMRRSQTFAINDINTENNKNKNSQIYENYELRRYGPLPTIEGQTHCIQTDRATNSARKERVVNTESVISDSYEPVAGNIIDSQVCQNYVDKTIKTTGQRPGHQGSISENYQDIENKKRSSKRIKQLSSGRWTKLTDIYRNIRQSRTGNYIYETFSADNTVCEEANDEEEYVDCLKQHDCKEIVDDDEYVDCLKQPSADQRAPMRRDAPKKNKESTFGRKNKGTSQRGKSVRISYTVPKKHNIPHPGTGKRLPKPTNKATSKTSSTNWTSGASDTTTSSSSTDSFQTQSHHFTIKAKNVHSTYTCNVIHPRRKGKKQ